jgi:phosphonate transport system permease protein
MTPNRIETAGERTGRLSGIPPAAAAALSLVLPGLGQAVAGKLRKGVLLFASAVTIVGLFVWRVGLLAHRREGIFEKLGHAANLAPGFVIVSLALLAVLWIWTVADAWRTASGRTRGGGLIFLPVLALFFSIGWQISEIDPVQMVTNFPAALPPLGRILWPWEAAIEHQTETVRAGAPILIDESENLPPKPEEVPGEPYLEVDPPYGSLSTMDNLGNIVPGTTITLRGRNFRPNTETQIWWVDPLLNEFRPRQGGQYVTVVTDGDGSFEFDLVMPYRLIPPSRSGQQIHRVEARQVSRSGTIRASEPLLLTISLIIETIFMGMMATFFGIILSIPVSFLSARNLMSGSKFSLAVYYVTRTLLNIVRSIEPLIWALIAVVWVGLGPFAGILALTIHTVASLGKLYSEAIENIDHGQIEAVQATGATRLQTIAYAVIPQMIPPFVSFTIYRWDINVRMSTVIGMVGGGGIGFILVQYIRLLDYRAAGIAVWFITITVAVLDYISAEIRNRFT